MQIKCTHIFILSPSVVDCGEPDTPSNGGVSYTITTEGSTIVYSCDPGFVLCGDENRTCLSTGMWSGSVPDCISEYSYIPYNQNFSKDRRFVVWFC